MICIAHRGNINQVDKDRENSPDYITEAVLAGYDVEVDAWYKNNQWWLGHDEPQYKINIRYHPIQNSVRTSTLLLIVSS